LDHRDYVIELEPLLTAAPDAPALIAAPYFTLHGSGDRGASGTLIRARQSPVAASLSKVAFHHLVGDALGLLHFFGGELPRVGDASSGTPEPGKNHG